MDIETTTKIETLRDEAAQHGDDSMVADCNRALDGDAVAIDHCLKAIAAGQG